MHLFEGLQLYEAVLLVSGAFLFLVLVSLLIYTVIMRRSYVGFFPFLLIPIVMMGFPGIQKMRFDKGIIEIETLTRKVEEAPTDVQAKKELEVQLQNIESQQVSSPSTMRTLEKAYTVVGDRQMAEIYRDRLQSIRRDGVEPR